jgi:biotin transport system substrate-specific component
MKEMTTSLPKSRWTARDLAYMALLAVIIAVCSWISIPATVPFTLQTFAIFLAVGLLGGKRGTLAVLVYILLGAVGIPVFSGFAGGIGVLFGSTGGYILGFLGSALVYWLITAHFGSRLPVRIIAMVLGLAVCYAFGTAWFMVVYARTSGAIGLATALSWCVLPFIIPDLCKLALAVILTDRIARHIKIL